MFITYMSISTYVDVYIHMCVYCIYTSICVLRVFCAYSLAKFFSRNSLI